MDGQWLLESDFTISDGRLEPVQLNELSTASELLRTPLPREFVEDEHAPRRVGGATRQLTNKDRLEAASALRTARSRYDEAIAKRDERMREALRIAEALLEPSGFDLSVLSVYMRAKAEVEGLRGIQFALRLMAKMLSVPWDELWTELNELDETAPASKEQRARRKNRWHAQLDTVLDQLCTWCATHPDALRGRAADTASFSAEQDWETVREEVSAALARRSMTLKRWPDVDYLLSSLSRSASTGPEQREPAAVAEVTDAEAPRGAPQRQPSASHEVNDLAGTSEVPPSGTHSVVVDGQATLRVSPQFVLLKERLAAFSELLREGQYARASLVAADLQRTLESFDVAAYFPGLFGEFFVGCAEHAAELAQFGASPDDPRWHALNRLYQTDLGRFLNLRSSDEMSRPSVFARSSADGVS